jgi:sucrose-6-phosphate hydrolase SacC (GH32 family)
VLAEGDGSTGGMKECPNFFPLGGKLVLLVGAETVTRRLFLRPDGTVGSRPVQELDSLHVDPPVTRPATTVADGSTVPLAQGDAVDVRTTIDASHSTARSFTLGLRASKAEGAELRYDLSTHALTLDTTKARSWRMGSSWSPPAA